MTGVAILMIIGGVNGTFDSGAAFAGVALLVGDICLWIYLYSGSKSHIEAKASAKLHGAVIVGTTSGFPLPVGTRCKLTFTKTHVLLEQESEGPDLLRLAYDTITNVDVLGQGAVQSGGGFMGGGFGAQGAVEGIVAASVLNALTTTRTNDTRMRLGVGAEEVTFAFDEADPRAVDMWLAELRASLRIRTAGPQAHGGVIVGLERLAALQATGALTDAEFTEQKRRLLG